MSSHKDKRPPAEIGARGRSLISPVAARANATVAWRGCGSPRRVSDDGNNFGRHVFPLRRERTLGCSDEPWFSCHRAKRFSLRRPPKLACVISDIPSEQVGSWGRGLIRESLFHPLRGAVMCPSPAHYQKQPTSRGRQGMRHPSQPRGRMRRVKAPARGKSVPPCSTLERLRTPLVQVCVDNGGLHLSRSSGVGWGTLRART